MLKVNESICSCFSAYKFVIALPLSLYLAYHIFPHVLSINHKCTQPCYFFMLLKPTAQKLEEICDSSMRSFRRAITPSRLPVEL
jgi:hypothetical protein